MSKNGVPFQVADAVERLGWTIEGMQHTVDGTVYLCQYVPGVVEPFTQRAIMAELGHYQTFVSAAGVGIALPSVLER